ncbi:M57 family metalloprotease [Fulvivirga ulvae]|uniref:M57 family metalloprotease n=1 Tax=Fulvivirga ulvae TaxID=2904245 RepID=UPI001F3146FB|nr:M57 family metalloprotease [Fulvivirga ulvae]UII33145.1 M57 family metalloprotease [Fulvivirga ulvae]
MKLKFSALGLCLLLFIAVGMTGCNDEFEARPEADKTGVVDPNDPVVRRIIDAGIAIEDIVAYDDHYVAEGDIVFYKEEPHFDGDVHNGREEQARSTYVVAPAYRNIRIYLDQASFSTLNLNDAVNTAISAFNAVGTEIQFSRVYSQSSADIVVKRNNAIGTNVCGRAGFPFSNGRPFNNVDISETTLINFGLTSTSQLRLLVAHEIGHCIGFRHTNWQSQGESTAIHIPGTPTSDGASVMNGSTCGNNWGGLSFYDKKGMEVLYATPTVPPPGPDKLLPGEQLTSGQSIKSPDNRFTFVMQGDGNLVLYKINVPLWSSNTHGLPVTRCIMQTDGNLVLYDNLNRARWSSNTHGNPGAWLVAQNDGNVVIYRNNSALWSTQTCCH